MKFKLPPISIYPKLVLTFLAVLLPLYAFSMIINESGRRNVKEEIIKTMVSKVQFYVGELDTDFTRIITLLQGTVNDSDLEKLSVSAGVMTDIEIRQSILRLQDKLVLIKETNEKYLENVSAHIPLMNRTVTANQKYIADFNYPEFSAMQEPVNRFESPFIYWHNRLFTSVSYPDPVYSKKRPNFILDAEVSQSRLEDILDKFTDDKQGGSFIFSNNHEWLISKQPQNSHTKQIFALLEKRKNFSQTEGVESVKLKDQRYIVAFQKSSILGATLVVFVPEANIFGPLDKYRNAFWWLSAISIIVIFIFSYEIFLFIHKPIKTLVRSFREMEQGNLNLVLRHRYRDEFSYLYMQFNEMVKKLNILVHEVYEQKYRARSSELKHLQSQINPHFLYNSFFVLYRMIKSKDYEKSEQFTKYLGDYFQFITRDGLESIPLELEVKYARTYTDIQTIRFVDRVQVQFAELPDQYKQLEVPRLILQPIIENAYDHGLENKVSGGLITINYHILENHLVISIEDNGDDMNDAKLQKLRSSLSYTGQDAESTGMVNVHRRIQIKYSAIEGLELSIGSLGGLLVRIMIPLHRPMEERLHV